MALPPSAPPGPVRPSAHRPRRAVVAAGVASLLVGGVLSATSASAAVPVFPDNLVVFPDRDFVTVEGFQDHVGEVATLQVRRGSTVVGSAKTLVEAGDVAFEVNHPGGACWGKGTGLLVTPDIVAGDVVTISFPDGTSADTVVQDAAVTDDAVLDGTTVRVTGTLGSGVDRGRLEQRLVNPDLVPLVGKRDVRALPGALTPAAGGAYSSGLQIAADGTFTATYVFDDAAAARTAAASGGERLMSWQLEDGDGNRQGLSIAEHGELGGPGMGGCPAGPSAQAAPTGTFSAVRSTTDKTRAQISWTPADPQPGAAPVTGYDVVALAPADADGRSGLVGARTTASTTRTTITGLDAALPYTFEVRSMAGDRTSVRFSNVAAPVTSTPPADQLRPSLTVTPAPGATATAVVETDQVVAKSETGADLYYAVGTAAAMGDLPSDTAKLYTGPIAISKQTELHFAAFDAAGNVTTAVGTYAPPAAAPADLAAPATVNATAGQESATVRWTAVAGAVGYRVTATPTSTAGAAVTVRTTALTTSVSGLTAGTAYGITVATQNSAGSFGADSVVATVTPAPVVDRLTVSSAKWKTGDFRIVGTGSATGATVSVRTGSATGTVIGTAVVTGPVAPATVGDFTLRLRNAAAGTRNPGQIWVTSSRGGTAGPITVVNG